MIRKPTLRGRFVGLATRLLHSTPRQSRHNLPSLNSPQKFMHGSPIALNLIVPPSVESQVVIASTTDELDDLVQSYRGTLRGHSSDGTAQLILRSHYSELSPSETYEIVSPYFTAVVVERRHRQVAGKAFEDKARNGLIKFVDDKGIKYRELDRTVTKDGKTVSEWEGILELDSGQMLFLECKHCVTSNVILEQAHRMRKTMKALGKHTSLGRVFVAGEYWKAVDGEDPKEMAQEEGFGLLFESGNDLTVISCPGI